MADDRTRDDEEYQTAYERLHEDADGSETLALDEDESLPWLESSDYAEGQGSDTGRIAGFALLGVIALALIVGAIWFLSRPGPDAELAGDGSAITAPDGAYKEKPEDAGGREFANTGDVAPAVGQGKTREARIADEKAAPTPAKPTATAPADKADGEKQAQPSAPAASGVAVQVGAYSDRARAEKGWQQLNAQTEKLSGVSHRVVEGTVDNATVYRLQAMAGSRSAASALCTALKADGVACQVK